MKRISFVLIALFLILLTACRQEADISGQVETIVAGALTQTAESAPVTPIPVPANKPVISSAQRIYSSSILGVQFSYPDNWYLQEFTDSLPATVSVTSFDPANPPHKLEWTERTISMQFRLLPADSVPPTLDAWVEAAKQTAVGTQLSIFEEELFSIANQPAVRLTLVSGSGGILHQVLTILDGRNYEINIEGNLDLGKSVLSSLQPYAPSGLKPAEGDTPAAGICLEPQGGQVAIVLGTDLSGMPLAGRCVTLNPMQRISLINQSGGPFAIQFANFYIDLPPGNEVLLDKPVGEYLAPGVHFLQMGPELWVKDAEAAPVATMPGPLRNYENIEAGYTLTLPPGWNVDEHALSYPNKEVIFTPSNPEPFIAYLNISLEFRTLEQIMNDYARNVPDAVREDTIFNGQPAIKYTYSLGRDEYFVPDEERIFLISTDKPYDGNIQSILMSIRFTSVTVTRYTNQELGYALHYPSGWLVDEYGLAATTKEIRFHPSNAEPFMSYLDIGLDPRTLDALKAQDVPNAQKIDIFFAGTTGVQYLYSSGRSEMYLLYRGQVYYLHSDKPTDEDVQDMITSFVFIES
ncbi:MAG TPA: hypothetical protein VLA49_09935 [Anaerolineales bacterium]|nr:hypothetical protein [Anaerolineales bacterium]